MRRPPKCPDCGSTRPRPIAYGEPDAELEEKAENGDVVLGGCCIFDDSPAWHCYGCGHRYGYREKPYKLPPARTVEEWLPLIETMLPRPVEHKDGLMWGGEPPSVAVGIEKGKIVVRQAIIDWSNGTHDPQRRARKFATLPLRAPAARVAELIRVAHGKRLGEYRWCPRCHGTFEPEEMTEGVCHECAERELGVVF